MSAPLKPTDIALLLRLSESDGKCIELYRLLDVIPETTTRTYEILFALQNLVVRGLVEKPFGMHEEHRISDRGRSELRQMKVIE